MMPHGSISRYTSNGCRCPKCRDVQARYKREWKRGVRRSQGDREALAVEYADDILLLAADHRAREIASRNEIPLFVVLRVLVPHYIAKGLNAQQVAERLGISDRTVFRHLRREAA